jgi:hypothetical protein
MANNLDIELEGKVVILDKKYFKGSDIERAFLCEDGFGCSSFTRGNAIIGKFLIDGEKCRVEGYQVKRIATKEEIAELKQTEKKLGI